MDDIIYVVYYAHGEDPVKLVKAFRAESRAKEYVAMLKRAPFPKQVAEGYRYECLHLN